MTKFHLFSQDSVRLETAPTGECVSLNLLTISLMSAERPINKIFAPYKPQNRDHKVSLPRFMR